MNELIVLPNLPAANNGSTGPNPDEQEKSRLKRQSWRRLGVAACALAAALGAGWAVGAKFQSREVADIRADAKAARNLAGADETARGDISALREEIRALQAKLGAVDEQRGGAQIGALEAKLASLDRKIETNRADAANIAAQIAARLEKNDKSMERLEAAISAKSSTAAKPEAKPAIKAAAAPPPPTAESANAKAAEAAKPIGDYTLREVQDGIALVQGRGGLYEVGPGDRLPGVGKVLAVERVGQKWVVVTERGRIDGQAALPQPRYSQRRDPGEYYIDQRF